MSYKGATDETSNGVALCALHHRAYDNALITFDEDYRIVVNEAQVADLKQQKRSDGEEKFRAHLRAFILIPPDIRDRPNLMYVKAANALRQWHK